MTDFIEKFSAILIVVILLGVAAGFIATNVNFFEDSDTQALPVAAQTNISLTQDFIQAILNVSNGTVELPVTSNYTLNTDDERNPFITIIDNTTALGTLTVEYTYRQSTFIRPAIAVIVAVLVLLVAVALIVFSAKGLGSKKR